MRAFISGITGFAGSHLAEHLIACGDAVAGTNRTGRWPRNLPERLKRSVDLMAWDVADARGIEPLQLALTAFQPEVIFHLAAISFPADCGTDEPTARAQAVNAEGTRHVLQLASSLEPRPRVVFASSAHVYGPSNVDSPPVDELAPLAPRGGYGRTKLAAEQVCREFIERDGLDVVVVRSVPSAGPRQDERLMLASWCKQFAEPSDEPVDVLMLDARIDMPDVRDVVRAYRLLAERGAAGETYNLGRGQPQVSGEVFKRLQLCAGSSRAVRELRPGRKFDPIANIGKLQSATGWQPEIDLSQTVADSLDDAIRRRVM